MILQFVYSRKKDEGFDLHFCLQKQAKIKEATSF